jgi:hypothetical protein
VADLALGDELLERPGGLLEGRAGIGPVELIQVHVVDAQRLQARLDPPAKPGRARVAHEPRVAHPQPALGGDHEVLPAVVELGPERRAQKPLRDTEAVGLRRVEEVDPERVGVTDGPDRLVVVEPAPVAS